MEYCNYSEDEDDSGAEETLTSLKHHYGSSNSGGGRNNPLLETISVIEFDSADDGMLYTGSVDSGYKSSCCPTPDPYPTHPTAPTSQRTAELDLDHLSSLRKTLLKAIERYDSRTKELLTPARFRRSACSAEVREVGTIEAGSASFPSVPIIGSTDDNNETSADVADGSGSRFSRVARCMLEIIEDLQRQRGEASTAPADVASSTTLVPSVPPKPIRMSKINIRNNANVVIPPLACETSVAPLPPATPPRVARKGRRKLPTPQGPPLPVDQQEEEEEEDEDLSGADYHLYEEILYDLGASQPWSASVSCRQEMPTHPAPPPLPARPSRNGVKPEVSPLSLCDSSSSWMLKNVMPIKPLNRRDRNNQLIRPKDSHENIQSSRSNVYTFGMAAHPAAPIRRNLHHHHHHQPEDEYGFRAAMV